MECKKCKYYEPVNGEGRCKVSHPEIHPFLAGRDGIWPLVKPEGEACGDFKHGDE